jgi:hypothetical protein
MNVLQVGFKGSPFLCYINLIYEISTMIYLDKKAIVNMLLIKQD